MEDHRASIKSLALEYPWPIVRRYAWGLGIILTISGFMTLLSFNEEKKERLSIPAQLEPSSYNHSKKDTPLINSFLTLPNGDLLDVSTPLTLYSSLFTPQEGIRKSVSLYELGTAEEFLNDGQSSDAPVEALSADNVAILASSEEQENKEKPTTNELKEATTNGLNHESLKSAPLVDIENKIKANNLIGKIEANIEGLKGKFRSNDDVGARKETSSNDGKGLNKVHKVRLGGISKANVKGKAYKRNQLFGGLLLTERVRIANASLQSKIRAHLGGIQCKCRLDWAQIRIDLVLLFCCLSLAVSCILNSAKSKSEELPPETLYVRPFRLVRHFI